MSTRISQLVRVLETLRASGFGNQATIAHVLTLLYIGNNPGITQTEINKRLKLNSGTVCRIIIMLSQYREEGELKGLNLVEQKVCLENRRSLACYLTIQGQELFAHLNRLLLEGAD